ncbi:hypothetical protein L226DRAFT_530056 [Lentinus tigrinus ALCF2SS1-7]|uniref:Zn(2)-C6 fungal-type domain-containing protein n=1 Tax=Lentinus tigrinus ALCF2SS1-6 TaxID=1328759 RepID=A0A5C2SYW7_9APHY|nr:hypothetical protein L227DRAFT_126003 [Lentinus tigrinus ALCF2SS1-6]RPD79862.1 hypothetical protein L226DRAFT_530056 [Lentinus tigrinus ALCF2SS1-7]
MSSVTYGLSRRAACNACAARKVKCEMIPGLTGCKRCFNINVRCEWPSEDLSCTGKRRKACDTCQESRVRCLVDIGSHPANTACPRCVEKNLPCSFVQGGNTIGHKGGQGSGYPVAPVVDVARSPPSASARRDDGPPVGRAPSNSDRTWWDVCLGTSQR